MRYWILILFACFNVAQVFSQATTDVYVFIAEKCPISIFMASPLRDVAKQFRHEVNFYAVFPMANSTPTTARAFLEANGLEDFEIVLDGDQHVAREYEATITPEVVVIVDDKLKYRGRISNAYSAPGKMKHGKRTNDLLDVLVKIKAEPEIHLDFNPAVGCYITFHGANN